MTTPHNHNPNFGRRVRDCQRCIELAAGARPVEWSATKRARENARQIAEVRAHNCKRAGCGPVCTFGQW